MNIYYHNTSWKLSNNMKKPKKLCNHVFSLLKTKFPEIILEEIISNSDNLNCDVLMRIHVSKENISKFVDYAAELTSEILLKKDIDISISYITI